MTRLAATVAGRACRILTFAAAWNCPGRSRECMEHPFEGRVEQRGRLAAIDSQDEETCGAFLVPCLQTVQSAHRRRPVPRYYAKASR